MIYGVKIGDKHSIDDWHLVMTQKVISPPEPQTYMLEVPQRDGLMDLTESLTGSVKFKNRIIEVSFAIKDHVGNYAGIFSNFQNYCHGKRMKIIFDDDLSYYYIGRIAVERNEVTDKLGLITLKADCEPYKYDIQSSAEPWLWDSFDFETGVINSIVDLRVSGTVTTTIISKKKQDYPKIIVSNNMTVKYKEITYELHKGENVMYDIMFEEGENVLTFNGSGTVTVDYRAASL